MTRSSPAAAPRWSEPCRALWRKRATSRDWRSNDRSTTPEDHDYDHDHDSTLPPKNRPGPAWLGGLFGFVEHGYGMAIAVDVAATIFLVAFLLANGTGLQKIRTSSR